MREFVIYTGHLVKPRRLHWAGHMVINEEVNECMQNVDEETSWKTSTEMGR
jgi:hypothetical protein